MRTLGAQSHLRAWRAFLYQAALGSLLVVILEACIDVVPKPEKFEPVAGEPPTQGEAPQLEATGTHRGSVGSLVSSADGRLIVSVGAQDGQVLVRDAESGTVLRRLVLDVKAPHQLYLSPDSTGVAALNNGAGLTVWELRGRKVWSVDAAHGVCGTGFSRDGTHLVVAGTAAGGGLPTILLFEEFERVLLQFASLFQLT